MEISIGGGGGGGAGKKLSINGWVRHKWGGVDTKISR